MPKIVKLSIESDFADAEVDQSEARRVDPISVEPDPHIAHNIGNRTRGLCFGADDD